MNCPKCGSSEYIKNGIIKGRQRYKCKKCLRVYTVEEKSTAASLTEKRIALILYLEGTRITTIAHYLKVSPTSVSKWIKKYGDVLSELRNNLRLEIEETDQLGGSLDDDGSKNVNRLFVLEEKDNATRIKLKKKI
jgi:transposase-like protein